MSYQAEIVYGINAVVVRRGVVKVAEVTITDGVDSWTFDTSANFTLKELEGRFPHFRELTKVPVQLPGQTSIEDKLNG